VKQLFLAVSLIIAGTVASADTTSVLLDPNLVTRMSAAEYAEAVRNAPDVNVLNSYSFSPLLFAAMSGTLANIAALLDAGADVNIRNRHGKTPLHYVARFGTPDMIAALLEAGASGSVKDNDGETPFDYAEKNAKVRARFKSS
jgi:ankyrin repeat protein